MCQVINIKIICSSSSYLETLAVFVRDEATVLEGICKCIIFINLILFFCLGFSFFCQISETLYQMLTCFHCFYEASDNYLFCQYFMSYSMLFVIYSLSVTIATICSFSWLKFQGHLILFLFLVYINARYVFFGQL